MPDGTDAPPDPDAQTRLAERIGAVRVRFLAGFDERVTELVAQAETAASAAGAEADAARHALGRGLHTIAGSAPTIGLPSLGERARVLEAELATVDRDGTPLRQAFIDAVAGLRNMPHQGAE